VAEFEGIARNIHFEGEVPNLVLRFTVDRQDGLTVSVEICGTEFAGSLAEGDLVWLSTDDLVARRDGVVRPRRTINQANGSVITPLPDWIAEKVTFFDLSHNDPAWLQGLAGNLLPSLRRAKLGKVFQRYDDAIQRTALSEDDKQYAQSCIGRYIGIKERELVTQAVFMRLYALLVVVALIAAPSFVSLRFDVPFLSAWPGPLGRIAGVILYLLLVLVIFLVVNSPQALVRAMAGNDTDMDDQEDDARGYLIWWWTITYITILSLLFFQIILTTQLAEHESMTWQLFLASAIGAVAGWEVLVLGFTLLASPFMNEASVRTIKAYPDIYVISQLLESLRQAYGDWRDIRTRTRILENIEGAARTIERGLAHRFGTDNSGFDDSLSREMQRRAAGFRMLKKQIGLGGETEQEKLIWELENALSYVLHGQWGKLPAADLVDTPPERLETRVKRLVRQLLTAFLPLLLLAGSRIVNIPIEPAIASYAWTAAVVWALVAVMLLLDPASGSRLPIVKDATDLTKSIRP
jgi:hypothetical protein